MALFSFYNMRKQSQFDHKPHIKGTFIEGTSHLKKSVGRGEDSRARRYKNVKLAVALAVLAAFFWYLFW